MEARDGGEMLLEAGEDDAKTVFGERIAEAHDEERDGAEPEHLARRAPVPAAGQSERDWAWCLEALRPRPGPGHCPGLPGRAPGQRSTQPGRLRARTLESAAAALRREMPGPEIER